MTSQATAQSKAIYAANLAQEKDRKGWTDRDIADRIGADPQQVSKWRRGVVEPILIRRMQIADLFGRDPMWFYEDRRPELEDVA